MKVLKLCLGAVLLSPGAVGATTLVDEYFFIENKFTEGRGIQQRVQIGVGVVDGTVNGTPVAFAESQAQIEIAPGVFVPEVGLPLFEFPFQQPNGQVTTFFGIEPEPAEFFAGRGYTLSVQDDDGIATTTVGPLVAGLDAPLPYIPIVSDVAVTGGNAPTVSWTGADFAELEALGVDTLRVRVLQSTPSLFREGFFSLTTDLSLESLELPNLFDLFGAGDVTVRIEYGDEVGAFFQGGEFPSFMEFSDTSGFIQRNRSTYQLNYELTAPSSVPLPAGGVLLITALGSILLVRRKKA